MLKEATKAVSAKLLPQMEHVMRGQSLYSKNTIHVRYKTIFAGDES